MVSCCRWLGIVFLFILSWISLVAQPLTEPESSSIRVDPEWVVVNNSAEFCWATDLIADEHGNTYSTGYFGLALGYEGTGLSGICPDQHSCNGMMFLIKRNAEGEALWVRYASPGHSRGTELQFDKDGHLVLLGNMYGDTLQFFDENGPVGQNLVGRLYGGMFLCRFDTGGNILKTAYFSQEHSEEGWSLAFDKKNNTYIGGVRHFRTKSDPALQQRAYCIRKLDRNWNMVWEEIGDTTGNSVISSVAVSGNVLYALGSYQNGLSIGEQHWNTPSNESVSFVLSMSTSGKFRWLNDSLSTVRLGAAGSMATDEDGNCYIWAGSSYSFSTLAKLDRRGKLVWSHLVKGRTTIYAEKILLGAADKLYICGQTYANTFTGRDARSFFMQSKGSVDGYIAGYSTDGELLWLKAMGGKGTEWCTGIGLAGENLYAFGFTDIDLPFYRKTAPDEYGNSIWLASFRLDRLADTNANFNDPLPVPERWPKVDEVNCTCLDRKSEEIEYVSPLDHFMARTKLQETSDWWQQAGDSSADHVFYKDFQSDVSSFGGGLFYSLTLLSPSAVRVNMPDSGFTLELFSCPIFEWAREQEMTFAREQSILKHDPAFDVGDFDSSAASYLDIALEIHQMEYSNILMSLIYAESEEGGDVSAIVRYKKKHKLKVDAEQDDQEAMVHAFLEELEAKKIGFKTFLLDEYVQARGKPYVVTPEEERNLDRLLATLDTRLSVKSLNRIIHPEYSVYFPDAYFRLGFDTSIIHPAAEKHGQASILLSAEELQWNTYNGLRMELRNICAEKAEIGNTGVLLQLDSLELRAGYGYELGLGEFPLYAEKLGLLVRKYEDDAPPYYWMERQPGIPFSGIASEWFTLEIPFDTAVIQTRGQKLVLNNKVITGRFEILLDTSLTKSGTYRLKGYPELPAFDANGFAAHLVSLGFTDVHVEFRQRQIRFPGELHTYLSPYSFEVEFLYMKP